MDITYCQIPRQCWKASEKQTFPQTRQVDLQGESRTIDKLDGGCGAVTQQNDQEKFALQEWNNGHPRWKEFVQCLEQTAPEQAPFVLGEYSRHLPCHLCVALQNEQVVVP